MGGSSRHLALQLVRLPDVIPVEKGQKLTAGMLNPRVSRRSNALIRLANEADHLAECSDLPKRSIDGSVVHDDDLVVTIGLIQDTLDGFRNESFVVVRRDDDADSWRHVQGDSSRHQGGAGGAATGEGLPAPRLAETAEEPVAYFVREGSGEAATN
jgi:hypothetical protein